MKDSIRYLYNRLTLKRHQVDCLCLPRHDSKGDITCYTHGSIVVLVSPFANYKMNYKSMKIILEEFKMGATMEKKRRKTEIIEQEVNEDGRNI